MIAERAEDGERAHAVTCRCGARYAEPAWTSLRSVRRVEGDELAALVVHWPDGVIVEVRACLRCDAPIARLRRAHLG